MGIIGIVNPKWGLCGCCRNTLSVLCPQCLRDRKSWWRYYEVQYVHTCRMWGVTPPYSQDWSSHRWRSLLATAPQGLEWKRGSGSCGHLVNCMESPDIQNQLSRALCLPNRFNKRLNTMLLFIYSTVAALLNSIQLRIDRKAANPHTWFCHMVWLQWALLAKPPHISAMQTSKYEDTQHLTQRLWCIYLQNSSSCLLNTWEENRAGHLPSSWAHLLTSLNLKQVNALANDSSFIMVYKSVSLIIREAVL